MTHILACSAAAAQTVPRAIEHDWRKSRRGDDTVGNPPRAQTYKFELFELILLLKLDKQFPIEQFEPTVSQSTVPSPPLRNAIQAAIKAAESCFLPMVWNKYASYLLIFLYYYLLTFLSSYLCFLPSYLYASGLFANRDTAPTEVETIYAGVAIASKGDARVEGNSTTVTY